MKFTMIKVAVGSVMVVAASSAQAILTSANTLSVQNDAVTTFGIALGNPDPAAEPDWYISSDGALVDSFYTVGGIKDKQTVNSQFAYLHNGTALTLTGATQSNIATSTFYSAPGSNKTFGSGISILSASGDVATVDMSGLKWDWNGTLTASLGSGAWSAGYSDGVGKVTCVAGSQCAVGSAYTLTYTATIPPGDPSGASGYQFYYELHGTVGAVPEVSTYGMMLSGLGLLVAVAWRRKQAVNCIF